MRRQHAVGCTSLPAKLAHGLDQDINDWNLTEGTRKVHFRKGRNSLLMKLYNGASLSFFSVVVVAESSTPDTEKLLCSMAREFKRRGSFAPTHPSASGIDYWFPKRTAELFPYSGSPPAPMLSQWPELSASPRGVTI